MGLTALDILVIVLVGAGAVFGFLRGFVFGHRFEDVFVGDIAQDIRDRLAVNPKALEREMAG